MNFLEAKIYDIFLVSRGEELTELVKAIDTLQEYHQMNGSDSEGRAVDLMLEFNPLTLDDVEEFALDNCLIYSEQSLSYDFDIYYTVSDSTLDQFDKFKKVKLEEGLIHQLQYDNYKYIGKHA